MQVLHRRHTGPAPGSWGRGRLSSFGQSGSGVAGRLLRPCMPGFTCPCPHRPRFPVGQASRASGPCWVVLCGYACIKGRLSAATAATAGAACTVNTIEVWWGSFWNYRRGWSPLFCRLQQRLAKVIR